MEKRGDKPRRDEYGRWLPGHSGNPSGGPKGLGVWKAKCRDFMNEEGWGYLISMATTPGKDQRAALELLAGYGFGKPTTVVAGDDAAPIKVESRLAGLAESELAKLAKKESPRDGGGGDGD